MMINRNIKINKRNKRNNFIGLAPIIFLLVALCFVFGCTDNRLLYRNAAFDIKMRYPVDWEKKEYQGEAIVVFLRPSQPVAEDSDPLLDRDLFMDNLSITIQDLETGVSLGEYTEDVLEAVSIMGTMKGTYLNILSSKESRISGKPAHQLVYTLTQYEYSPDIIRLGVPDEVQLEGASFQILQTWVIHRQRAYIFTFMADRESYQNFIETVYEMILSIRLT